MTMDDGHWQKLEGLDADSATFPARAKVNDEGILIFRTKDGFRGVERTCPHLQASLIDAMIVGNGTMLRCAKHNYTFRLSDGKGVNCPGHRLRLFEVRAEGQDLLARAVDHIVPTGAKAG
jgi:nitrite reductase/ring-hydroxylating ferredoxin subunit